MSEKKWEDVEGMTFKQASVQLEQVVRALESGELELEEALEYYGRGTVLLDSLRERLADAEQKVQVLANTPLAEAPDTQAAPSEGIMGNKSKL